MLTLNLSQCKSFLLPLWRQGVPLFPVMAVEGEVGEQLSRRWRLAMGQAGNGSRFLIAPNRMWACKLLTWDARSTGGLGKSPGGGWGGGQREGNKERLPFYFCLSVHASFYLSSVCSVNQQNRFFLFCDPYKRINCRGWLMRGQYEGTAVIMVLSSDISTYVCVPEGESVVRVWDYSVWDCYTLMCPHQPTRAIPLSLSLLEKHLQGKRMKEPLCLLLPFETDCVHLYIQNS